MSEDDLSRRAFFERSCKVAALTAVGGLEACMLACQSATGRMHDDAVVLYEAGSYDGAIDILTKAIAQDPANARLYNLRGKARAKKGELSFAAKDFNDAIRTAPEHFEGYLNQGILSHSRYLAFRKADPEKSAQFTEDALHCLCKATELNPLSVEAQIYLGFVYDDMKDPQKAWSALDKAVKLLEKGTYTQAELESPFVRRFRARHQELARLYRKDT